MKISHFLFLFSVFWMVSCVSTQKVNTGDMAFEFKQYHKAIQLFKEEVDKTKLKDEAARKSFLIAVSYERLDDVPSAMLWYQRSYELGYGDQALFKYAVMLKRDEQYTTAIDVLTQLVRSERSNLNYRRELTTSRQALQWKQEDQREYEVELLDINSSHSDFQLQASTDGILYFSSDRRTSTGEELYHWTGQKFMDVFEIPIWNLQQEPVLTEIPINTDEHESTPTLTNSGKDMVFCRCTDLNIQYDNYCVLYHAIQSEGKWRNFQVLPFILEGVNYMHPVFSEDGTTLYYASDDVNGFGKYDLWAVSFENGTWGVPVNLGKRINTEGQEVFPTIHNDTLYFSTDFRTGLGGLDIFKTYYSNSIGWIPPIHLPYPVNSGGDDMSYIKRDFRDLPPNEGFLVSSRKGGIGADDIYLFRKFDLPEDTTQKERSKLELEITVKGEIYQLIRDPNSGIADYENLVGAKLTIVEGEKVKEVFTNEAGSYVFDIQVDKDYFIMASANGYLNKSERFSSFGIELPVKDTRTYLLDISLPQKITNTEIVLENIYYDYDKAEIRADAAKVLDTLATLFNDNPDIQIELGSHTDCRGEESYNYDLSLRRAQAAVDYLIKKGVEPSRIEAKGYGESKPAVDCVCEFCTEEEYQKNRRTTFKILE